MYIWYSSTPTSSAFTGAADVGAAAAGDGTASGSTPSARPCARRNSGSVCPKMNRKMNSTLTMMNSPPNVISPVARRSIALTRRMRADAASTRSRTLPAATGLAVAI
jgi:hypothetical protein